MSSENRLRASRVDPELPEIYIKVLNTRPHRHPLGPHDAKDGEWVVWLCLYVNDYICPDLAKISEAVIYLVAQSISQRKTIKNVLDER